MTVIAIKQYTTPTIIQLFREMKPYFKQENPHDLIKC